MSWIQEIETDEASGDLRCIYDAIEADRGKISNIMKVHSLNPGAMRRHLALYVHLMFGASGLSRRDREAIAVTVSEANACDYCVTHHRNALAQTPDAEESAHEDEAAARRRAATEAYVHKLTTAPDTVTGPDVERLREVGYKDRDILDIVLVAAYFNFVNRIALGLGVEFNEEEASGYVG